MDKFDYIEDYEVFMNNFKRTEISGAEVGEMVVRMAAHFAIYNVRKGNSIEALSKVKSAFQSNPDPSTGKPISAAKANTLSDATPEANTYEMNKIHVENIEQYINALKSLQKGILIEYSHTS